MADDDPEDREIFMDALSTIDPSINTFFANDGEKAIQVLNGDFLQKPDMIFLDLNMPFLTGKQVLEKIKSMEELKNIPVVMYSTFFNAQDLEDIKKLGAVHCLVKPTAFDSLLESLRFILTTRW